MDTKQSHFVVHVVSFLLNQIEVALQYEAGFCRNGSDSTAELLIDAQGLLFIGKRAAFLRDQQTQITCMQMHLHACAGI